MDIFQIDAQGQLFIAPDIDDWQPVMACGITAVFDLDSDLDIGVPAVPDQLLYIYFPFEDRELPNLAKLHALAQLGALLVQQGHRVLSHCGMGHNRSALLAGLILTYLGMPGADAVALLRQKRQGALYNKIFASYLQGLPHGGELEDSPSEAGCPTRTRFTEFKLSALSFENRRPSALSKPNIDTDGEV